LATIYRKECDYESAFYHARKAKDINPESALVYNILISIYKEEELWDVALGFGSKAMELEPENFTTYLQLAYCYKNTYRYSIGCGFCLHVLHFKPRMVEAFLIYVECLLVSNNWESYEENMQNLISIFEFHLKIPNNQNQFANFMLSLLMEGNLEFKMQINMQLLERELITAKTLMSDNRGEEIIPVAEYYQREMEEARLFQENLLLSTNNLQYHNLNTKKIKIGFLVEDIRSEYEHACLLQLLENTYEYNSSATAEMLEIIKDFEKYIIVYQTSNKYLNWTQQPFFLNLRERDEVHQLVKAGLIRKHNFDIVIYLESFTKNMDGMVPKKIFQTLATRPSKIQVVIPYNGFTRNKEIFDYLILDKIIYSLKGDEYKHHFQEKVVILNESFLSYNLVEYKYVRSLGYHPSKLNFINTDINEESIIYANFSESCHISKSVFQIWIKILQARENSILLLREDSKEAAELLRQYLLDEGIEMSRIIFMPIRNATEAIAPLINKVDLYLESNILTGTLFEHMCISFGVPIISWENEELYPISSQLANSVLNLRNSLKTIIFQKSEDYIQAALSYGKKSKIKNEILTQSLEHNFQNSNIFSEPHNCDSRFTVLNEYLSISEDFEQYGLMNPLYEKASFLNSMDIIFSQLEMQYRNNQTKKDLPLMNNLSDNEVEKENTTNSIH
jgi:predicted O-linked N-acetylglucosamine transferase (SPINDLY family)